MIRPFTTANEIEISTFCNFDRLDHSAAILLCVDGIKLRLPSQVGDATMDIFDGRFALKGSKSSLLFHFFLLLLALHCFCITELLNWTDERNIT